MKCPHCLVAFHYSPAISRFSPDGSGAWGAASQICPACKRLIIEIVLAQTIAKNPQGVITAHNIRERYFALPLAVSRPVPPGEVPSDFADDYVEASRVLSISPKASAALSRRCLQHLLREKAGVKHSDLAREIQEVLSSGSLPSHLAEAIDAIRNIGNFAAHPIKSTSTGEVVAVEPGEADWNLDVLDGLFDFYFVQPGLLRQRKAALDAKLSAAGKPPSK